MPHDPDQWCLPNSDRGQPFPIEMEDFINVLNFSEKSFRFWFHVYVNAYL